MTIGIGGAGSKLAVKIDPKATIINVSENELSKVEGGSRRILAAVHADHGQFKGSRKDTEIGREGYQSIRRELLTLCQGDIVFSSTGGGTGAGITTALLEDISGEASEEVPINKKTTFVFILPHARLESTEFTENTIEFLSQPLSQAIDTGNTGNIMLFSNRLKFESRMDEDLFNGKIAESLQVFLDIPKKNAELKARDGHIDVEDFTLFRSKPYFNHFTHFEYSPNESFEKQLKANYNPLLLPPENPIEAMFLLEVPTNFDPTIFYNILEYFVSTHEMPPVYSVVENPALQRPVVTVSLLYSRKPAELVDDFNETSHHYAQEKVTKSVEQYVTLKPQRVDLMAEAKKAVKTKEKKEGGTEDVAGVLKRIGKL